MAPLSLKIVQDEGAVTRTVKFESTMRVGEAQGLVREKILTAHDGKETVMHVFPYPEKFPERFKIWVDHVGGGLEGLTLKFIKRSGFTILSIPIAIALGV